jgi:beta-N-acetylhexosaminidase
MINTNRRPANFPKQNIRKTGNIFAPLKNMTVVFLLLTILGCAGVKKETPADWVELLLKSMTVEQKIGQMMVMAYSPRFYNEQNPEITQLLNYVKDYGIGGVMIFQGEPYAVARTIDKLQQAAETPLWVMADIEWGISMRVQEGTTFLPSMAVGATGSEDYAYQMGKITAREAQAIGIQVGFVPVMDVNNNPDNIIINTRSFGEDPQLVAKLGSAFIKGLQENGVYATAKHYPGHGDTDVDSHLGLPIISASPDRIRKVELVPFKAAVDAGVKFVMVAHITYSSFPQMNGRPATLEPYFVQEVLRKQFGFQGLVISDAMDMGGIVNNYWSGDAAVRAINSGANMILMTPNFEATYHFIVQAVKEGRIPTNCIDNSVRKILQAKFQQGLNKKPQVDLNKMEAVMANTDHLQKAEEIANAAMTLVRDQKHIFPLHSNEIDSLMVLTITDGDYGLLYENRLLAELRKRIPVVRHSMIDRRSCRREIQKALASSDSSQAVIAGFFVRWGSYKGSVSLPDSIVALLKDIFQITRPLAVISFGSPYLLRQLPETPTYLCAYDTNPLAIRSAVRALFGEIPLQAKLPVSIPGFYDIGEGLERDAYSMELVTNLQDDFLQNAYSVLEEAIVDSIFPGAQIAIVQNNELIASRGFGRQTYDLSSPAITPQTMYDLASVTKVAATTLIAMKLYEQNLIRLDISASNYLPQFQGGLKDSVTLRHLLTHSAGIRGWDKLWEHASNRQEALKYIYNLPLTYPPGDSMVYSDLGIIMVGEILNTVTGKSMDQLTADMFIRPLGLKTMMYNPPKEIWEKIAPTEIGGGMNRGLVHGTVHDENTFFLGGVSSHAGLFSNAEDLAVISQMLLNNGIYHHQRFFKPATIHEWTTPQNIPPSSVRALGWDTPSLKGSSAGDRFSAGSFGHTGFTGTSIWMDPERKIAIILLTNRVYPTRERPGIYQVRRDFYNAAMEALLSRQ